MLTTLEAIAIVIELAEQNVIDARDMPEKSARQQQAIEIVRALLGKAGRIEP